MAQEIERKFLVRDLSWKATARGVAYRQGYLSSVKERTVRVRVAGEKAYLTIKGVSVGVSRSEFEYEVPLADAEQMLTLCERPLIEKIRYQLHHEGLRWEVDEFLGENEGLIVAELELTSEAQPFSRPSWLGKEVSDDPRYFNSNLMKSPYKTWSKEGDIS